MSKKLKFLFLGDITGKPGRKVLKDNLASLKEEHNIDFCIANAENIAHGRGATVKTVDEVYEAGVDFFTGGNHIFRNKDIFEYLQNKNQPIIRPANYPDDVVGEGHMVVDLGSEGKVLIIGLIGKAFFNENTNDPFRTVDSILEQHEDDELSAIIVDFHAEATSEKIIMGHYLDGRVSAMLGTHTHVPTADERLLKNGTAFITDIGMVGPMDSSLWVKNDIMVQHMMYPYGPRFDIEEAKPWRLDGVIFESDGPNKATSIERLNLVFN